MAISPVLKSSTVEFDNYQNIFVRHFASQSIVTSGVLAKYRSFLWNWTPSHIQKAKLKKSITGHNFWLECPTDLRVTPLCYIFNALFRDTSLAYLLSRRVCHICHVTCRVDIWRDRCDRRSRKYFCELRKFLGKQRKMLCKFTPKLRNFTHFA